MTFEKLICQISGLKVSSHSRLRNSNNGCLRECLKMGHNDGLQYSVLEFKIDTE